MFGAIFVIDEVIFLIKGLFTKFNHEPTEAEIQKLKNYCVFCNKAVVGVCGTPLVKWFGCCIGYSTPTKRVMDSRVAHSWCYIRHLEKIKVVELTKLGKEHIPSLSQIKKSILV